MQSAANDVIFGTVTRTPSELCSLIQVLTLLEQDTIGIFQDLKFFSKKMFNKKVKLLLALAKILIFLVKTILNVTFEIQINSLFFGKKQSFNLFLVTRIFSAIVGLHSEKQAFL